MRLRTVYAGAVMIGLEMLAGCTGQVGSGSLGSAGTGAAAGSAAGTGSGSGSNSSGGAALPGGGGRGGVPGTGNAPGGGATATGGASAPGVLNLDGSPQYYRLVRLTNAQWGRAVQDVLKLAAPSGLEQNFQSPVNGTTDFSNNELVLDVNQTLWSSFASAAEALAAQVTATDSALAKVYSGTDAAGFITTLGRRAYRRPLTPAEQSAYLTAFNQGSALMGTRSNFAKGASLVIRTMLQSPYFLYRTELSPRGAPLSGYEMATKLSLWLRGTTPSDTLLDAAAGPGKLDTVAGAVTTATTMLAETTAIAILRQFHGELLHFDRYGQITKVNTSSYKPSLNTEFQDISNLFFDKIFIQNLGLREILTSTNGFVGPGTAPLYGLSPPASGYVEKDLGPQRFGYFSQLPFLALYGFNGDPDSIHRGVAMNLDLLCATLGPPAAVLPPIPPLMPGQTNRQRIDTLTSGCGAQCHNQMINPIGFAFEHFDGMGQYRDTENSGLPIDSSGSFAFMSGTKTFASAADLMKIAADDPQAHLCYAKKLSSFGLQRDITTADMSLLQSLASASMAPAASLKNVILQLVRSDAFRTRVGGN